MRKENGCSEQGNEFFLRMVIILILLFVFTYENIN